MAVFAGAGRCRTKTLRPWLVLVVGTAAEVLLEPDGRVTLMPTVTAAYDLEKRSARWAHVQQDDAPRMSCLVSERTLRPVRVPPGRGGAGLQPVRRAVLAPR